MYHRCTTDFFKAHEMGVLSCGVFSIFAYCIVIQLILMKRFLIAVVALVSFVGCTEGVLGDDPADAFVGEYTAVDKYYVRWGSDNKSSSLNTKFMLSKLSSNQVKMIGAWTTTGTVTGNTIRLDPCPETDNDGYVNYTFGVGTLSGNTLTFSYSGTGSRRYSNGVAYPWETSGTVTATKK